MLPKTSHLLTLIAILIPCPAFGGDRDKPADKAFQDYQQLPREAKAVLEAADKVELYSLDPTDGPLKNPKDGFHGWKVLGKTALKEAKTRKAVREALYKGVEESFGVAGCFHPRHGLRATHDGKTVDLVICFECAWMSVVLKGKGQAVWTSASPQKTLDWVLREARVPLPPKPDEE